MKKRYTKKELLDFLEKMQAHRYGILFKKKIVKEIKENL